MSLCLWIQNIVNFRNVALDIFLFPVFLVVKWLQFLHLTRLTAIRFLIRRTLLFCLYKFFPIYSIILLECPNTKMKVCCFIIDTSVEQLNFLRQFQIIGKTKKQRIIFLNKKVIHQVLKTNLKAWNNFFYLTQIFNPIQNPNSILFWRWVSKIK